MDSHEVTIHVSSESARQQMDVFARALEIFHERTHVRGDLWAKFDIKDAQKHIESKNARVTAAVRRYEEGHIGKTEMEDAVADDALDMMNYAAFIVRHAEKIYP